MFICPECGRSFPQQGFCTEHGAALYDPGDDLLPGKLVGSYRVARLIGRGGMGEVYLAVQPEIGSRVAIKILAPQCASNPQLVERFFAEARAVNLIRHESIVNMVDLARLPDGRPYIVMEFLDGAPLAELIARSGPLPIGGVVALTLEVLDVLGSVHARGITHRDLKPDNVFVTAGGRVKVLDFGIAKLKPELQAHEVATRTGALLGTPHYMSPEQARTLPVDHRSDLYSTGVILYEALTGRRPFEADALYDLLRKQIEEPPPSLRALRPELPPALEQVVLRALQKDPALRFQDAAEFARVLTESSRSLPPESFGSLVKGAAPGPRMLGPARRSDLERTADARSLATGAPTPVVPYAAPLATAPGTAHTHGDPAPSSSFRWFAVAGAAGLAFVALAALAIVLWQRDKSRAATPFRVGGGSVVVEPGGDPHAPVSQRPRRNPPATIDPAKYELDGQFDAALDLARTYFPDAQLVIFSGNRLNTDGTADLTQQDSGMTWQFQSAKSSPKPSGDGMPSMGQCIVVVSAIRGKLQASMPPIAPCVHTPVALPSCTVRQVVEKALLGRSPKKISVAYKALGKQGRVWSLSIDGSSTLVPDDC